MVDKFLRSGITKIEKWAKASIAGLFFFNLAILLLVLLRFAGYFAPFLTININFIYLTSLVLSVILLKVRSRAMFAIALGFWLFGAFLKIVRVDIWAERTIEYFFQAVVVGVFLMFYEYLQTKSTRR